MIKRALTFLAATAFIFTSCSENNTNTKRETTAVDTVSTLVPTSYLYTNNGDTISLNLQNSPSEISGVLNILPYEKDCRMGKISNGKMSGDTLFALFTSSQEGQDSECEIAFLKNGEDLVFTNDIYGESNYQYNKDYTKGIFIDKSKIKFDGEVLKKVNK
jgi:hypothetical protein